MASRTSALLAGFTTPAMIVSQTLITSDSLLVRIGAAVVFLSYIVLFFMCVQGPASWDRYRWVPNDGMGKVLARAICWLLGVSGSMIIYLEAKGL